MCATEGNIPDLAVNEWDELKKKKKKKLLQLQRLLLTLVPVVCTGDAGSKKSCWDARHASSV